MIAPPVALLTALALTATPARPRARQRPATQSVYHGRSNQLRVRPPRLEETGSGDGALDEPQWAQGALLTGFSQFSPQDGGPAEDSTEVYVCDSATAMHFGIPSFQPPGAAPATLADRD